MPEDYPRSPPKASFKTKIWHPNTIACLLIQPNPDSALNAAAGSLLQDDYEDFARQARLMTSIHAPIPDSMKETVMLAKSRGDDNPSRTLIGNDARPLAPRQSPSKQSVVMKKRALSVTCGRKEHDIPDDEDHDPSKENDPSLSLSPAPQLPPTPRASTLGKRPLSALPTPIDPDLAKPDKTLSDSELNIAANSDGGYITEFETGEPLKKSPKFSERNHEIHRPRSQLKNPDITTSDDLGTDREERIGELKNCTITDTPLTKPNSRTVTLQNRPSSRKTSATSSSSGKGARVGIRRL
ncbi:MAG: hypothetical protein Q9160_005808 [Pyrenula sp. 1 TL-2023]